MTNFVPCFRSLTSAVPLKAQRLDGPVHSSVAEKLKSRNPESAFLNTTLAANHEPHDAVLPVKMNSPLMAGH